MPAFVVDTPVTVWYLLNIARLSIMAREAFDAATGLERPILVPAILLVVLTDLVEKGREPSSALQKGRATLADSLARFVIADVSFAMVDAINEIPGHSVPDSPNHMITEITWGLRIPMFSRNRKTRVAELTMIC